MSANEPRDHHYVPQFYLRNFAVDAEKRKIETVAKNGQNAVWARRSISRLGFETDLYVHVRNGVPISVERAINEGIETPISKSDTWAKIASGRTEALDRSDKPILYALIRHLNSRTPHQFETTMALARMAASGDNAMPFTDDEREHFAFLRADPQHARMMFNAMASTLDWAEDGFKGAGLSIGRSPIPLRSSSVPVMTITAHAHPALRLPLPGTVPFQLVLPLSPTTYASLVLGDFDDGFVNSEVSLDVAMGFNRLMVGHFSHFAGVRHLITAREDLVTDMTWAPYDLMDEDERRMRFLRRATLS